MTLYNATKYLLQNLYSHFTFRIPRGSFIRIPFFILILFIIITKSFLWTAWKNKIEFLKFDGENDNMGLLFSEVIMKFKGRFVWDKVIERQFFVKIVTGFASPLPLQSPFIDIRSFCLGKNYFGKQMCNILTSWIKKMDEDERKWWKGHVLDRIWKDNVIT